MALAVMAAAVGVAFSSDASVASSTRETLVFTVTTQADVTNPDDGVLSLREAIVAADVSQATSVVELATDGHYLLSDCAQGAGAKLRLHAATKVVVQGDGATIDQTCPNQPVLDVQEVDIELYDLTVTGAHQTSGSHDGGLALNLSDAVLDHVIVEGNTSSGQGGGAGVLLSSGSLVVRDSTIRDNHASNGAGGGIYAGSGTMVELHRVAVIGNTSVAQGGGVMSFHGLLIENSTFVGNAAALGGGAIWSKSSELVHTTVMDNGSPQMYSQQEFWVSGTTFSEPRSGANCDVGSVISSGWNRSTDASCELTDATDVSSATDPGLRLPFDNGGVTPTAYPEATSPLLDLVPAADPQLPDVDQRGVARAQGSAGDIGSVEVVPCGGKFPDVSGEHPFCWEIGWLDSAGVTGGYPDGTFRPAHAVTRQSMAAFLYRLAGEPAFEPPPIPSFTDVSLGHPFFAEIEWLASTDITTGFPDGTFRPGTPVSRQSMAAFLYRLAGEPAFVPPVTPSFADVALGHPFFAEIEWLASTDIASGFPDGTYRPTETVTRQSMAAFLYRYVDGQPVAV